MKKRGQTAMEAMIVIAMLLIILTFIVSFKYEVVSGISNSYYGAKVKVAADNIVQSASQVYRQGSGAKDVIYITVPREVEDITLSGYVMNITYKINGVNETIYRKTDFFMNGTIPVPNGTASYCILIEARPRYVEVKNFNGSC